MHLVQLIDESDEAMHSHVKDFGKDEGDHSIKTGHIHTFPISLLFYKVTRNAKKTFSYLQYIYIAFIQHPGCESSNTLIKEVHQLLSFVNNVK